MYYYINGVLAVLEQNSAVIDCGGVGYKLAITANTHRHLGIAGGIAKLFTYLNVREDALDLFGFYDMEELTCFKQLLSVSGVGPKVAIAVLSELTPEKFAVAVVTNNPKALTAASGVGAKLAQRVILELKDKIKNEQLSDTSNGAAYDNTPIFGAKSEALNALAVLGYTKSEAEAAINKSGLSDSASVEEIIKAALKQLMKG